MHLRPRPRRSRHEPRRHHPQPPCRTGTCAIAPNTGNPGTATPQPQPQHRPRPHRRQQPRPTQRPQPRQPHIRKRRQTHPTQRPTPPQRRHHRLHRSIRLHINVQQRIRQLLQQRIQPTHRLPTTHPSPTHHRPRQRTDHPTTIRRPIQRRVMMHHHHTIRRRMHIRLQVPKPLRPSTHHRTQRVLHPHQLAKMPPPMRERPRIRPSQIRMRQLTPHPTSVPATHDPPATTR